MAPVRKVGIVFAVIFVGVTQDISGGEAAGEGGPGQPYDAQDELHVRLGRGLDDDRQQVPGGVDEAWPELNKGQVLQVPETAFELLDHPLDDEGTVISRRQ